MLYVDVLSLKFNQFRLMVQLLFVFWMIMNFGFIYDISIAADSYFYNYSLNQQVGLISFTIYFAAVSMYFLLFKILYTSYMISDNAFVQKPFIFYFIFGMDDKSIDLLFALGLMIF